MDAATPRTTPEAARGARRDVVDRLNARWDLGIPRAEEELEGSEDQATPSSVASRCYKAIKILSWRLDDLEEAIDTFDRASQKYSGWQWKANQAPETLPAQPSDPSEILRRKLMSSKSASPEKRKVFLELLLRTLGAAIREFQTRESATWANNVDVDVTATKLPRPVTPPFGQIAENMDETASRPNSKRPVSDAPEVCISPTKKRKSVKVITNYFPEFKGGNHTHTPEPSPQAPPRSTGDNLGTSFDTVVTTSTQVFSQPGPASTVASSLADGSQESFPADGMSSILQDDNVQRSLRMLDNHHHLHNGSQTSLASTAATSQRTESSVDERIPRHKFSTKNIASALRGDSSPFKKMPYPTVDAYRKDHARRLAEKESLVSTLTQSGRLEWVTSPDLNNRLFTFAISPVRLEKSCRFHRAFGSDRFMLVYLPSLTKPHLPDPLKPHADKVQDAVSSWLAREKHFFLGRTWKAFFLEPDKSSKPPRPPQYRVMFFAESGIGIEKLPIRRFLQWHIPVSENIQSTDCKAFQRFSLGLSKTLASVVLEPMEFARIPGRHPIMNDGCARMSESLARSICDTIGLNTTPSVFQGRIAGAKGMWMVDRDQNCPIKSSRGYYIEVSDDSQLKILPHPADVSDAPETQRTFEVLQWSRPPRAAAVNFQLLTILHDRGISKRVLKELLENDTSSVYEDLKSAADEPLLLRPWINGARTSARGRHIEALGQWPREIAEQAILMVESGFKLSTSPVLHDRVRELLKDYLSRYIDRFQIRVPLSTSVYCIADPYGVLAEDEIHCGFSSVWDEDPDRFNDSILDGFDVLVARSPAFLASDIQRRKARFNLKLRHFRDVVVFPTKGTTPLASMLSGGDYDGDTVWLCWDQTLVEPFQNSNIPTDPPSKVECGIESRATELSSIFQRSKRGKPRKDEVNVFFKNCFSFNLQPNFLGHCASEFDKLVYDEGSISSPHAVWLATTAGYLVDAAKAGSLLTEDNWNRILKAVSPRRRRVPAYRDSSITKGKSDNILDYLKFIVADRIYHSILTDYKRQSESLPGLNQADGTLTALWETTEARAVEEVKSRDLRLKTMLEQLWTDIDRIRKEWKDVVAPRPDADPDDKFLDKVSGIREHFQAIQPKHIDHPVYTRYLEELGDTSNPYTHWALLRASCLYQHQILCSRTPFFAGKCPWYLAGGELCELKSRAQPQLKRAMLQSFYIHMKFDARSARRFKKQRDDNEAEAMVAAMAATRVEHPAIGEVAGGDGDEDEDSWGWMDGMSQIMLGAELEHFLV